MSKSLPLLLALAVLVALPAVTAQVLPAATITLSISGLPANVTSNGTLLALPFRVQASVTSTGACLAQPNAAPTFTVNLSAAISNGTSNNTTVSVAPASFTVQGPSTLSTPGNSATRIVSGTLLVDPGTYTSDSLKALVKLTASTPGGPVCTGAMNTASATTDAQVATTFYPVSGYGTPGNSSGRTQPFVGAPLLLVALAALVLALRRSA